VWVASEQPAPIPRRPRRAFSLLKWEPAGPTTKAEVTRTVSWFAFEPRAEIVFPCPECRVHERRYLRGCREHSKFCNPRHAWRRPFVVVRNAHNEVRACRDCCWCIRVFALGARGIRIVAARARHAYPCQALGCRLASRGLYILSNYAAGYTPVGRLSLLTCLGAPVRTAISMVFLGTHVSALDVVGIAVVVFAVALPSLVGRRRSLSPEI